ncbi:VpsF family polysaccharide biosynthesis protein [Microbulbifer marinus]|uniref:Uncharacterized protein n=1 Tax=Microbulbifer marinus TaxID=658218 RepID=A0A1H4ADG6_9GAMM|nr:VpsF family polysaccharide biosynthesis protein [Microbulbifer marinus]SEA34045.1 hypothetical protein SAMN05216562_2712 [Microbulbifer marinus]
MSGFFLFRYIVLVLLSSFFFGAYLLESLGVKYVSEGGSAIAKIHFASYLTMFIFGLLFLRVGYRKILGSLGPYGASWSTSVCAITFVIFYGLARSGTSGLAYLVDTFLTPLLIIPVVAVLDDSYKNKLIKILAYLLLINSIVALLEFVVGKGIALIDFSSYFRSTAFLSHPLNNALITASLAPVLMDKTRLAPGLYFSVVFLALFAYGGRAAMAVFMLFSFASLIYKSSRVISGAVRFNFQKFAYMQFIYGLAFLGVLTLVIVTPVGNRIFNSLYIDASAQVRFDIFFLLEKLSLVEWFLGAKQSLLNNVDFYIGVNVIENYLVAWILSFGVVGAGLLLFATYRLPLRLVSYGDWAMGVSLLSFIIISLTNNSLSAKTPALLFLMVTLFCLSCDRNRMGRKIKTSCENCGVASQGASARPSAQDAR